MASNLTRLTYNAQHKAPWHWQVPAYLVTKGIASGVFMIMAAVWLLGLSAFDRRTALVGNGVALLFLAITTVLLVADLERPERFLRILTRPQWKSWLTRGAFILIGFSLVCTLWFALEMGSQLGWLPEEVAAAARFPLMVLGFPLALLTAIYTAFLFGQCEGRDLWQSKLMPWHMGVQALMAGGAVWLLLWPFGPFELPLRTSFLLGAGIDLVLRWTELSMHPSTSNGRQAAWIVRRGSERRSWLRSMACVALAITGPLTYEALMWRWHLRYGDVIGDVPILFAEVTGLAWLMLYALAALLALIGLFLYESVIIKAGQDVPNA